MSAQKIAKRVRFEMLCRPVVSAMIVLFVSSMGSRAPQCEQCSKRSLVDGRVGLQFMPTRLDLTSVRLETN